MVVIIVALLFYLCGFGNADHLTLMIRQLQIILNLPIIMVAFPANFIAFVSLTLAIALFDFLEFFVDWETIFTFREVDQKNSEQTENMGYESHNAFANLNTLAVMLLFSGLRCILGMLAYLVYLISNRGKSLSKKLND